MSEEESDEIVREIDVYVSPELSTQLHLVQFPLQEAPCDMSQPDAARIRPQHTALQLEFADSVFDSYHVPVVTHLALGRLNVSGTAMQLVPLQKVLQMRPFMDRAGPVDGTASASGRDAEIADTHPDAEAAATKLFFQRPESDKLLTSRRTSFAFHQASLAAEPWLQLQVMPQTPDSHWLSHSFSSSSSSTSTSNAPHTLSEHLNQSAAYIKTLNYIPPSGSTSAKGADSNVAEAFRVPLPTTQDASLYNNGHRHLPLAHTPSQYSSTWKKELTSIITQMLQTSLTPIPYLVLRSRFPPLSSHVSDEDLLEALSSCATLVQGNVVLKSCLLPFSNPHGADARDFILLLFHKYGLVHRDFLIQILSPAAHQDSTKQEQVVSSEGVHGILTSLGRKTSRGVAFKVERDTFLETHYPQITLLHAQYWARKEEQYSSWLHQYNQRCRQS